LANNVDNFSTKATLSLEIVNRKKILQSVLRKRINLFFLKQKKQKRKIYSKGKFVEDASFFDAF
jgi:hypothetical protein